MEIQTYDSKNDTIEHIYNIQKLLGDICMILISRAQNHDSSKLAFPEKECFDKYTPKLKGLTYDSNEYKQYLKEMGAALDHHYMVNEHHPEHHENGIQDMTLVDLIEMLCDWKAATMRHADGNIVRSVELNQKRFNYSDEIKQIFLNTIQRMGWRKRVKENYG